MPSVDVASNVMWVYAPPPDTSSPLDCPFLASPQRTRLRSLRWVLGVR